MKTRVIGVFTTLFLLCGTLVAGDLSTSLREPISSIRSDSGVFFHDSTELDYHFNIDPTADDRGGHGAQESLADFDEWYSLSIRRQLADSVFFIHTIGAAIDRDHVFLFHKRPDTGGVSSLVVDTGALEWKPTGPLTLDFSIRASQAGLAGNAGAETRFGYEFDATLVPFTGATICVDVRRENETGFDGVGGVSDFYYASFDYQFPHPALSFHVSGWSTDRWLDGTSGIAASYSELEASVSWQINDRLWWSTSVEWDFSNDAVSDVETCIRSFKSDLVFQVLDNVSLGLSLAYGAEQAMGASSQAWTSIRAKAKIRVTDQFKVEAGVGSGGDNILKEQVLDSQSVYLIATISF